MTKSSRLCKLVTQAQAHFVKTSTGFANAGATLEHVRLMRETVGQFAGVKAAGGVRNGNDAQAMIEAGATRIGTSNGVRHRLANRQRQLLAAIHCGIELHSIMQ